MTDGASLLSGRISDKLRDADTHFIMKEDSVQTLMSDKSYPIKEPHIDGQKPNAISTERDVENNITKQGEQLAIILESPHVMVGAFLNKF